MLPSRWREGLNGMGLIITWTTNKNSAAMGGLHRCETDTVKPSADFQPLKGIPGP